MLWSEVRSENPDLQSIEVSSWNMLKMSLQTIEHMHPNPDTVVGNISRPQLEQ